MAVATEDFIKQIDEMTVLELNTLVKALEDHYGVSAAAAAVAVGPAAGGGDAAAAEEKDEFDVVLTSFGDKKINVIKGSPCHHWSRPQRGQGPGGGRAVAGQGRRHQGRGRRDQEEARRRWRPGGAQVDRTSIRSVASSVSVRSTDDVSEPPTTRASIISTCYTSVRVRPVTGQARPEFAETRSNHASYSARELRARGMVSSVSPELASTRIPQQTESGPASARSSRAVD